MMSLSCLMFLSFAGQLTLLFYYRAGIIEEPPFSFIIAMSSLKFPFPIFVFRQFHLTASSHSLSRGILMSQAS